MKHNLVKSFHKSVLSIPRIISNIHAETEAGNGGKKWEIILEANRKGVAVVLDS